MESTEKTSICSIKVLVILKYLIFAFADTEKHKTAQVTYPLVKLHVVAGTSCKRQDFYLFSPFPGKCTETSFLISMCI